MTISTLIRYLAGHRRAILEVAESKSAVWLGLLFVISAGFAREYDGVDLLHEPWHLALPLGASLATSFLLFCVLWFASKNKNGHRASFLRTYRMFLGTYWMTAPLAWLYAIPVERMFSAAGATQANLWLLGIVATWRVILMTRVVCVLFEAKAWQSFFIVMLYADTLALLILYFTPIPIVSIMGGIRLTESEHLIRGTAFMIGVSGVLSLPFLLIGALSAAIPQILSRSFAAAQVSDRRVSLSAWMLGVVSVLLWAAVLPQTQTEQQLRRAVENDLRAGRIDRALATMSQHQRSDFPPLWDPPPRIGYGEQEPPILDIVEVILANDTKSWISNIFVAKLQQTAGNSLGTHYFWGQLDSDRFDRFLNVLEQLPESSTFVEDHREALAVQLKEDSERTEAQKARIRALLGEDSQDTDSPR